MNEIYFVASESESPDRIFFTKDEAENSRIQYIDSFDKNGIKVASYKLDDNEEYYTTDF